MKHSPSDQPWDPTRYDEQHSFVWKLGADLVGLLSPKPGERILDVGCGTGHLTAKIAACGAEVIGIDADPGMVDQARTNYPSLCFEVVDGREFRFDQPFDAVFSNAVLHWITEPETVVTRIERALKPAGRFVAEFGGKGNVQMILAAVRNGLEKSGCTVQDDPNPWYFPSIGEYAMLLERHGLETIEAILFDRPTPLEAGEAGLRNWLETFAKGLLAHVPTHQRSSVLGEIEAQLRPTLYTDGAWQVDYRRIRIIAVKKGKA